MNNEDERENNKNPATDITVEPELDSDNARDSVAMIRELKEKLKISQKERNEYLKGWQRAKADFINARKDDERAMSQFVKISNERIILDIIPALDSFHSAFGNKTSWEKVDLNWRMGVQYIYSQLLSALEKSGVTLIQPRVGEPFDAEKHEGVATVPTKKENENHTVAEVVQKGYALHGKILQPAKIKLAEYHESSEQAITDD